MKAQQSFEMPFAAVYPAYVKKAERKDRTKEVVDSVIRWLTGYNQAGLMRQIEKKSAFRLFSPRHQPCTPTAH